MKKKSSIIKLSIIGVVLILGLIMSFCSFNFGLTTLKSFASAIKLGLDLKGGVYAVYENKDADTTENLDSRMNGTRTRLESLLISKGYTEASVVREGKARLRVEVPDVDDPGKIFSIIGKPAQLSFEITQDSGSVLTVITGEHVLSAESRYDSQSSSYVVALKLNAEGAKRFGDATANNIGKEMPIKIKVEGEEPRVIASPKIESAITNGEAVITNMGQTPDASTELADQITSGQFEVKLSLLESSTVSPTLGDKALLLGVIAGIVGLFLVMLFLCFIYRGYGLTASISLLIYLVLMLFFLAFLPWVQLTLPGIAGIILSLGMAVDANIIIYERIRDEYKNGKSIMAATHAGFKKATMAIVDSNVTTIIAAVILLIFGTGSIKGFALTLLVGIILSLFTSLLVTRKIVKWFIGINSTNASFYGLKRGAGFEGIAADDNTTDTETTVAGEGAEELADKANKNKSSEGGVLANENI